MIGNPPYASVEGDFEGYLRNRYQVTQYFIDLFHTFIEQGMELVKLNGQFGYIVPEPWFTMENTERLRGYILNNSWIREILRFDKKVFEDATVDTAILITQKGASPREMTILKGQNERGSLSEVSELNSVNQSVLAGRDGNRIEIRQTAIEQEILDEIRNHISFSDVADVSIGIQAYNRSKHTKEQIKNRVFHSDHRESEAYLPEISGRDVSRYSVNHDGETWVKYGDHLHDYRPMRYFSEPRILVREITDAGKHRIHAAYTDELYCNYKTILNILRDGEYDLKYLLGVLNSTITSWVFPRTSNKVVSESFPRISVADIENLPLPKIQFTSPLPKRDKKANEAIEQYYDYIESDNLSSIWSFVADALSNNPPQLDVIHDFVSILVNEITEATSERESLNLSLPDYLGAYTDGPTLGERYQPPAGLADSILTDTAEERANLRVGTVTVTEEGGKLLVRATARYKPENPEAFETDRWGYTETDPEPAMEFVGLTEGERALIRAFVPHAVGEAGGFAGFRETATKTNSLVDRLEALTLPELAAVEDGLERYRRTKARVEELDEKIEKTDELIDQIVYRLYGLTDEEIEIVEEAVGE